ncbi:hypothetical protein [Devosia sp.]|uniref:hypothetical protein n=1 Tax=Devosia sp. TaxID=1871048 RepID=UPI001A0DC0C4|nr:hypothetical protein [Devosia sp.]MBE0581371.1 hypothetical protein [Devosia sp.]
MNDPRVSALICAAVAIWLGYTIFFAAEAPSTFLLVAQWTFFLVALAGLSAALARILRGR